MTVRQPHGSTIGLDAVRHLQISNSVLCSELLLPSPPLEDNLKKVPVRETAAPSVPLQAPQGIYTRFANKSKGPSI